MAAFEGPDQPRRETRRARYGRYTGGPDPLAPPVDLRYALADIGEQVLAGASVLRLHGVLVGIGADYAEIALVPEGQRHQARGPVRRRILPLAGLCTVTSTAAAPGAR